MIVLVAVLAALGMISAGTIGWVLLRDHPAGSTTVATTHDGDLQTTSAGASPSADTSPSVEPTEVASVGAVDEPASPLDIPADYVNQPCTGSYIVMLATSGDAYEYEKKLGDAVRGVPGAKYLRGADSCSTFIKRNPHGGDLIYNAYVGPFPDASSAFVTLSRLTSETAWVRKLSSPSKERELGMCQISPMDLQVIGGAGMDASNLGTRRLIAQVQWFLYEWGLNDRETIYGNYTAEFDRQVRAFQSAVGLPSGGLIEEQTWTAIQSDYCPESRYLKYR